jgi:antitoxin VapB
MMGVASAGETKTDNLFTHGRGQAERLPKEFRLPGKQVRVSWVGHRVILEPIARSPADVAAVFAEIDRLLAGEPFPDVGSADDPPVLPDKRTFFDA